VNTSLKARYSGCLLGLACGDAVGTSVEFSPRGSFTPLTDMVGGGPFNLKAGQWTDDTSMALCLAESLLTKQCFDPNDQMARYLNWWQWGYLSATGECFDIGTTVRQALEHFQRSGDPYAGSQRPSTAGNGSLMRLAPVVLRYHPHASDVAYYAVESSRTTHAAPEALECCQLFAELLIRALAGHGKEQILAPSTNPFHEPNVQAIAAGGYLTKPREQIHGTGYCVQSLEAALWCFATTASFEDAVLAAANLGDDADTTAAITGQLAGAFYGEAGIPAGWLSKLFMCEEIRATAQALLVAAAEGEPT
jgi:ADP-ribosyl-[dinitrogen reductase] hydrolase